MEIVLALVSEVARAWRRSVPDPDARLTFVKSWHLMGIYSDDR